MNGVVRRATPASSAIGVWRAIGPAVVAYLGAVVLVFVATAVLLYGVAWARAGGRPDRVAAEASRFAASAGGVMAAASVSASVLAAIAVVVARCVGGGARRVLRLGPARASAAGVVAAIAGMAGLSLACGTASDLLGARGQGNMEVIAHALRQSGPGQLALAVAAIAVAPAVAEEAFFRGLIQTRLVARWGRWPGVVITAAAFGLIHLDVVQGALAFVAGLFLGWVAERFGSIRPSVAAHAVNNAAFVLASSVTGEGGDTDRTERAAVLALSALVWISATAFLRSRLAVRERRLLG